MINLTATLTSFGFFPNYDDVLAIINSTIHLLDGRRDIIEEDEIPATDHVYSITDPKTTSDKYNQFSIVDISEVTRYRVNEKTFSIMESKRNIIRLLLEISKLRDQFLLSKFLYIFKDFAAENQAQFTQQLINQIIMISWTDQRLQEAVVNLMDDNNAATNKLNFSNLSAVSLSTITIDLLMYDDENMFEEAFRFLSRQYQDIETLMLNAKEVQLLPKNELPIFRTFEALERQVAELRQLFESAEQWVRSIPSITSSESKSSDNPVINDDSNDDSNRHNFEILGSILDNLELFLANEPKVERQESLYLVDIHRILLMPLGWDLTSLSTKTSKGKLEMLKNICVKSASVLIVLVDGHDDIPKALSKECDSLLQIFKNTFSKELKLLIVSLFIAIFKGKKSYIVKTPIQMFTTFASLIYDPLLTYNALIFFKGQLIEYDPNDTAYEKLVEEDNIPRNQTVVFRSIQESIIADSTSFPIQNCYNLTTLQKLQDYILFVEIIGLCCRRNGAITGSSVEIILPWESCANLIRSALSSKDDFYSSIISFSGFRYETNTFKEKLRYEILRVHINLIEWVNLNSKAFDEQIVLSRLMYHLALTISEAALELFESSTLELSKQINIPSISSSNIKRLEEDDNDYLVNQKLLAELQLEKQKLLLACIGFLQSFVDIEKGLHTDVFANLQKLCEKLIKIPMKLKKDGSDDTIDIYLEATTMMNAGIQRSWRVLELLYPDIYIRNSKDTQLDVEQNVSSAKDDNGLADLKSSKSVNEREKNSQEVKQIFQEKNLTKQLHKFVDYIEDLDLIKTSKKQEEGSVLSILISAENRTDPNESTYVQQRLKIEHSKLETSPKSKTAPKTDLKVYPVARLKSSVDLTSTETRVLEDVRTVKITFGDLIKRFIVHIDSKIDGDLEHVVSSDLIDIMARYLEDALSIDKDAEEDLLLGVDEELHDEIKKRQAELGSYGVVGLVYRLISMPDDPYGLRDKAYYLGSLLFQFGNQNSTKLLLDYAKTHDSDGRFFSNIKQELVNAITW